MDHVAGTNPLAAIHCALGAVEGRWLDATVPAHYGHPEREATALVNDAVVVDLSSRGQLEIAGDDRASFLHNLCTNEIRKLAPGAGCEVFFLNAKGHVVFYGYAFCGADNFTIDVEPGAAARLLAHLDRYLIRERVTLVDRSAECGALFVGGPAASANLQALADQPPPAISWGHLAATVAGCRVKLRRVPWLPVEGFEVVTAVDSLPAVWQALLGAGIQPCGHQAFDAARIAAGTPYYGIDITADNLPQEVARDLLTINFNKGCYLGQETVARIDALGHVNRTLVGLKVTGAEVPAGGAELKRGNQVVGQVTSAARWWPTESTIALGYVRRGNEAHGTELELDGRPATVVGFPLF